MPSILVNKTIQINKPAKDIYAVISDFKQWTIWSPWLIAEPSAKVTYSDDGNSYEWSGKRVGVGNMKIGNTEKNRYIDYDLNFVKPWKSHAYVSFKLEEQGKKTSVTWSMKSKLPIFLFWMKKSMTAYIGLDYDRGLKMLKEFVEQGSVSSKLEFEGEDTMDGFKYIGIRRTINIDQVGEMMGEDIDTLNVYLKKNTGITKGVFFSQYIKWDLVKKIGEYIVGYGVDTIPKDTPKGITTGEIPNLKIYALKHIGSYDYLANAWSATMAMMRSKEIKPNKKIHPFEVYENDPSNADEKGLITKIVIPVL